MDKSDLQRGRDPQTERAFNCKETKDRAVTEGGRKDAGVSWKGGIG